MHRFFPNNIIEKRSSHKLRLIKPKKIDSSLKYIGTRVYLYDRILINDGRCVSRARCSANTCFSLQFINRFYTLMPSRCLWLSIGPFSMWNHIFLWEFAWKKSLTLSSLCLFKNGEPTSRHGTQNTSDRTWHMTRWHTNWETARFQDNAE